MRICSAEGCAEPKGGAMLGYAVPCCYCCMHVVTVSHWTVETVACIYRAWTLCTEFTTHKFIWGDICKSICPLMCLCSYMVHMWSLLRADLPAAPVCLYVCMKVQPDVHRALCSSALMSGYFPPGWLYDIPALIYVHTWGYNSNITTLGLWFEVRKLCLLSIS